jgi:hypothetical protein
VNSKRIVVSALVLLLLAGCGGGKYAEEKTLLTTVTKAMETFTSSIGSADTPEAVAGIITTFTGQIEKVIPKMKELTDAHPEWENNPPKELKAEFEKFKSASSQFQSVALPKAMQFAREHADNTVLQGAIEKFSNLMSQM